MRDGISLGEFHHNAWTDYWAKTGIAGFAAVAILIGSMIVAGRRMVRESRDKGFALIGALGFAGGIMGLLLGLGTMSINGLRGEIVFGILCGVVLRCRAMQIAIAEREGAEAVSHWNPELESISHSAYQHEIYT